MKIKDFTIKGVIFDIDGVVLDSMPGWKEVGRSISTGRIQENEIGYADIMFTMSLEQGIEYVREHYRPDQTAEEIKAEMQDYLHNYYYYEVMPKDGIKELMEAFKAAGIKMTVATSGIRDLAEHALERNGLLGYIDKLFTSTEVGSSKHSPEIYNLASAHMGTAPEETMVFEDALYALKTVKAAGYHTTGVYEAVGEPDQEGLKAEADIYIQDPAEFLNKYLLTPEKNK